MLAFNKLTAIVGLATAPSTTGQSPAFHYTCPEAYVFHDHFPYKPGDRVSVPLSDTDKYSSVYQCNDYGFKGNRCSLHHPGSRKHPDVWTLIATCDGSPICGCPEKYSSNTIYSSGDHVAVHPTDSSDVGTLFECKSGEESVYCNSGSKFGPASENSSMGWIVKGPCSIGRALNS